MEVVRGGRRREAARERDGSAGGGGGGGGDEDDGERAAQPSSETSPLLCGSGRPLSTLLIGLDGLSVYSGGPWAVETHGLSVSLPY